MNGSAELGPRLRAERERRGISVQKAADELRLDAWAIEALETDQFDRLGAAVFAKGHLKQYAALLGLPFDEIAASYESLKPRAAEPAVAAPETRARPLPSLAHLLPWRRFAVPGAAPGADRRRTLVAAVARDARPAARPAAPGRGARGGRAGRSGRRHGACGRRCPGARNRRADGAEAGRGSGRDRAFAPDVYGRFLDQRA